MKVHRVEQNGPNDPEFIFECPGCKCAHWFKTTNGSPRWQWNNDFEKPTIQPSLLVMQDGPKRCHSFVENGKIRFLADCWHELKNQTVDLPDLDE